MRHSPSAALVCVVLLVASAEANIRYAGDRCGTVTVPAGKSSTAAVRCCAKDGSSCDSDPGGKCFGLAVDFNTAGSLCKGKGSRLCTWDELKKCCGTGCGYDNHAVWFDNCQGNKCDNGQCQANLGSYTCKCDSGYTGEYCDKKDVVLTFLPSPPSVGYTVDACGTVSFPLKTSTSGAVRCCQKDGKKCFSTGNDKVCLGKSVSLQAAISACSANGHRLCSLAELKKVCCGTGCGYDGQPLWFDNCQGNKCDHGKCVANGNSYKCACDKGYTGTYCNRMLTIAPPPMPPTGDAVLEKRVAALERLVTKLSQTNNAAVDTNGRLKGAVAAMGRQLVAVEQRTAERVREQGNSGLTMVRAYHQGTDAYHTPSFAAGGAANMHNHANTHHTIGLGEFGAVLNGVQFTTRHNDYSLLENDDKVSPAVHTSKWPPRARAIPQPRVPPSVLRAGSVAKQVEEMREYFRAFKEQDTSIRDYRPYFPAVLCYLEGTWVESAEGVDEPFSSERHHIDAESWSDLNEKTYFLFNNGQKNNLENLPYLPTTFRGMRSDGENTFEPIMAQWFYRISCKKLKEDVPTSRFRVRNDLHVQMKESKPATREKLSQTTRASFDVNPTVASKYNPSKSWPKGKTRWEYMDELMYQVSGLEGPRANLTDDSFGAINVQFTNGDHLNTAFYTRYYSTSEKDAMGRTTKKRSFNDLLYAAQTTHSRVSPQSVCADVDADDARDKARETECSKIKTYDQCSEHAEWKASEVSGESSGAKCVWVGSKRRCVYKKCWEQRWSYAIPLEMVYLTPLHAWNPYNIAYAEKSTPEYKAVTAGGRSGSYAKPYNGTRQNAYFRTPATFFGDLDEVDEADTSGSTTYVLDKKGTRRAVRATGHWIHFPEMGDLGKIRQRYPVFPVHEHGSTIYKEVKALEELVVGANDDYISAIIDETREAAYGIDLELITGGAGHSHEIHVTPDELKKLKEGTITALKKVSDVASGHQHYVRLVYNRNAAEGREWSVDWCNMGPKKVNCPVAGKGSCNNPPSGSSVPRCCDNKCPDGHSGIRVLD
ncbi:hypothetical protein DIPPA_23853 [Diplonema papillatum]|nr:hypothetical protein DIPPA_23853 [Diplonema papillatum]